MADSSTAVLDVLTNGVGAMLILAVLFITKVGEDAEPPIPLAASGAGTQVCDFLVLEVKHAMQRSHRTTVRFEPTRGASWTWRPQEDGASALLALAPQAFVSQPSGGAGDFTMGLPLTSGAEIEVTTDIDGELGGVVEELQVRAFLTGSALNDQPSSDPSDAHVVSALDQPSALGTQSSWMRNTSLPAAMLNRYGAARFTLRVKELHGGCG
jgi:hypothetical protein